jgi:hypothetical protein
VRWAVRNLECNWLARRLDPGAMTRVLYEDFTEEPERAVRQIGRFLGRDLNQLGRDLAAGETMAVIHLVAGNALRMKDGIVVRPVSDWTAMLPAKDRRTFWLLAGRIASSYGYRR